MAERRRGNEAPAHNRESVVDGGGRQSSPRFGGRREKRRGDRRTPEAKFFGRPQAREKAGRDGRTQAEGEEMSPDGPTEERVIYRERFQAAYFDFRGKSIFTRYDRCEFVKCTLLIDHAKRMHHVAALVIVTCLCALGYGWNGRNPRNVSSYFAFAVDDAVSRHPNYALVQDVESG